MSGKDYIQLQRKGRDLMSKPRYVQAYTDNIVELREGSTVRFLWPNEQETFEKIISNPADYQTPDGRNGLRTVTASIPTIRINHKGLDT